MPKSEFVRARIEPKLKKKVEGCLAQLGLNASQAITLFYQQVLLHQGLPFEVRIPNAKTKKTFEETDAKKNLAYFENAEALFEDLGL